MFIDKIVQLKQWQLYYFVDNEKGANPNYQETAIVVAGTQVPGENFKDFGNQPYYWKKNRDIVDSSYILNQIEENREDFER